MGETELFNQRVELNGQAIELIDSLKDIFDKLETFSDDMKIETINQIKLKLHDISPLRTEPVDCVIWVKNTDVTANDYNPNSVAPKEMDLLKISIMEDGYTQPIVTFLTDKTREVVDGFHRNRVGKECDEIQSRVHGYLPVVTINEGRTDKGDRMASTIRHNRARGKHKVESMSEIVMELRKRNWKDEKIAKELGMEADEVLRLCQITGLAEMFADRDFSEAWEADNGSDELIVE